MTPHELERLYALLRVPSISAEPAHAPDLSCAAELVADEVRRAGGEAEVRPTDRHPLVLGEVPASDGAADAPRVIVYGHYDVQPPGPEDRWSSPPFEPVERDGNLYARGASDDKGNLFMLLVGVQRLAAAGRLPVRVSVVVDGEEESGGDSAVRHIAADAEPADAALIFDMPMVAPGRPALCTGLRGLVYRRVTVRAAATDAHSGLYGGAALNAAVALGRILEAVTPREGRLPDALYVGVAPAGPEEVAAWAELPRGQQALDEAGLRPADPGAAEGFYLRTFASPSLDVHGLAAGDPGLVATAIPGTATATLSVRVAPGQDALQVAAALDRLLADAAPEGAEVTVEDLGTFGAAYIDPRQPAMAAVAEGLERALGARPVPVRTGGTIPVVAALAQAGVPTALTGFGLPGDAIHAPDEHLRVAHLGLGARAAIEVLTSLGGLRR